MKANYDDLRYFKEGCGNIFKTEGYWSILEPLWDLKEKGKNGKKDAE